MEGHADDSQPEFLRAPVGLGMVLRIALDVSTAVLGLWAFLHILWLIGRQLGDSSGLVFIGILLTPLVGGLVGSHSTLLETTPSWRKRHRALVVSVGVLALLIEVLPAGIVGLSGLAFRGLNAAHTPPASLGATQSYQTYVAVHDFGILMAITAPLAPLFLALQLIRPPGQGRAWRQRLLRNAHWMSLLPLLVTRLAVVLYDEYRPLVADPGFATAAEAVLDSYRRGGAGNVQIVEEASFRDERGFENTCFLVTHEGARAIRACAIRRGEGWHHYSNSAVVRSEDEGETQPTTLPPMPNPTPDHGSSETGE